MKKTILVTSALPYANGPIHIGHLLEYIQTDIYVRAMKLFGHSCHYLCADDAHGTPIMIKAKSLGIEPEQLIEKMRLEHLEDFAKFHIEFDYYHSTHSEENREITNSIYNTLKEKGLIKRKNINQYYDTEKKMFLPDRYIKGTCPNCNAENQYGDGCEECGEIYSPTELINPTSALSDSIPQIKTSEHLFFSLHECRTFLQSYIDSGSLQKEISNKMREWLNDELRDWDISRDGPYFGFTIPGEVDKYFYVWLDAPIGYMAATKKYLSTRTDIADSISFDEFWSQDANTELVHVIGKDISYFHCLFWPSILQSCGYRLPNTIQCHGFITLNGRKMSKSKDNYYSAGDWAQKYDPEHLRYFYASKINGSITDLDLNLIEYQNKINSEIIGKLINIPSRCVRLLDKYCSSKLANVNNPLSEKLATLQEECQTYYRQWDFASVTRATMKLADEVNAHISEVKPWELFKQDKTSKQAHETITTGIECFRVLVTCLAPIIPEIAKKSALLLGQQEMGWEITSQPGGTVNSFRPLSSRVDVSVERKA